MIQSSAMRRFRTIAAAFLGMAAANVAGAQEPRPIRTLSPLAATAAPASFGSISEVRELSRGRLLVHDANRRQVLLLDSSLTVLANAIDSARGRPNSYGNRAGGLIPYSADSTLFLDADLSLFMVLDHDGVFSRVKAVPLPNTRRLDFSRDNPPAFHTLRGLLLTDDETRVDSALRPPPGAKDVQRVLEDSLRVLAVDTRTRQQSIVATARIGLTRVRIASNGDNVRNPAGLMLRVDDWALMPDGAIAVVRGKDYHVDWIAPDGSQISSPPIEFPWHRFTPAERQRITDSITIIRDRDIARMEAEYLKDFADAASRGRPIAHDDIPFIPPRFSPSEIPDSMPVFGRGAALADADGNLWIRTNQPGGRPSDPPVFDIVNRNGALIDRVRLPTAKTLVGFGKGGHIYLRSPVPGGMRLERLKVR
jgi:hypothetical protein